MTQSEQIETISKISNKAVKKNPIGIKIDKVSLEMDIICVHNSIGLDLKGLLEADTFNFFHDIFGIMSNLNRATGKLENFFLPRFSRKVS